MVQVITKPGVAKSYSKFKGQLYALKKEEGGRHTPFVTGYRPQFFFRCAFLFASLMPFVLCDLDALCWCRSA
jgi:elongation factor Tu